MKKLKRVTGLALAMLVLALSLPTMSVLAADVDLRYGRTKLSTVQQYIYDALVVGCESANAEIKIDISGCNVNLDNDLGLAFLMFYSDYPEYFWVTGGYGAESNKKVLKVQPQYSIPGGDLNAAKSKYNKIVQELTAGLTGSDYDKAKTLHDRLIGKVVYTNSNNDQNAYGALVEGKAVCNGYSRAYQHLMNKVGIPAWYVQGVSVNPSTGTSVSHAWNTVKIDGNWYYTDVTWDDQRENTFYTYFNITTEQLLKGHRIDAEYATFVPDATATAANYYKVEDRVFTGYDQNKLVNLLKQDGNKTQIYVDGDVKAFGAAVKTNMLSIGKQLGGTGAFQVSYRAFELGNALIYEFTLPTQSHTHRPDKTVQEVKESCLANGTKGYYQCDCGVKFLDEACTTRIDSDSELIIPAKSHTPSAYKNNSTSHWKECTECSSEIAKSRGVHSDENKDNQCDTCTYAMPAPDQGNNTPADDETTTNNDSTANDGGNGPSDVQTEPEDTGTSAETENTETTEESGPDVTETTEESIPEDSETTEESVPDTGDTATESDPGTTETTSHQEPTEDTEKPHVQIQGQKVDRRLVIYVGVVVIVAAAIAVILIKKKK